MAQPPSSKPPATEFGHTSRRGALRVAKLQIPTSFSLAGDSKARKGTIVDLSATGALLVTEEPLTPGQELNLEFSAPKGPRIKGGATVARCLPPKDGRHAAGIAFNISVEAELELAQWVFDRV